MEEDGWVGKGRGREVEAEAGIAGEVDEGEAICGSRVWWDGGHEVEGFWRTCPCAIDGAVVEDAEPAGHFVDHALIYRRGSHIGGSFSDGWKR